MSAGPVPRITDFSFADDGLVARPHRPAFAYDSNARHLILAHQAEVAGGLDPPDCCNRFSTRREKPPASGFVAGGAHRAVAIRLCPAFGSHPDA